MLELTQILKEHKLKVTPQRLCIFKILCETTEHPTAEAIYNSLKNEFPTMSLATVYKTLDTLVQHGLIQQLNVGEDSFRYDATVLSHPHVKCVKCGQVMDIHNMQTIKGLREEVKALTHFDLMHEQLYFFGTCPTCQKN
ncbi:transcriptional repressor [Sporanaerobium hydrogeniformans]|uniref:Transcriptional repressor n=1 Tax=Sporanaerobium hydrogeniformans TaxID=3072179 RepID=A0AC61DEF4_9FIRM|nr:Fur family transcriptional regulator [Sporanaerobium hydrogeniformans]PHV71659.1 transcriptional repressor [Sporanaerobium hydrogeniformans]